MIKIKIVSSLKHSRKYIGHLRIMNLNNKYIMFSTMNLINKHGYEPFSLQHKVPVLVPELTNYKFLVFSLLDFYKYLKMQPCQPAVDCQFSHGYLVNYIKKHQNQELRNSMHTWSSANNKTQSYSYWSFYAIIAKGRNFFYKYSILLAE